MVARLSAVVRASGRVVVAEAAISRSGFTGVVRSGLIVAGLVMFTLSAWTVTAGLGLFVGGLCALYFEFLLTDDDANPGAVDSNAKR